MTTNDEDATPEPRERGVEPSTGPGPGDPAGTTLPHESEPAGAAEKAKEDVGFGRKNGESGDSASG